MNVQANCAFYSWYWDEHTSKCYALVANVIFLKRLLQHTSTFLLISYVKDAAKRLPSPWSSSKHFRKTAELHLTPCSRNLIAMRWHVQLRIAICDVIVVRLVRAFPVMSIAQIYSDILVACSVKNHSGNSLAFNILCRKCFKHAVMSSQLLVLFNILQNLIRLINHIDISSPHHHTNQLSMFSSASGALVLNTWQIGANTGK